MLTSRTWLTFKWLAAAVAVAGIYLVGFRGEPSPKIAKATSTAGWDDLIECSETQSFDRTRSLSLNVDNSAELREAGASEAGKRSVDKLSKGTWSYDAVSKQYAVNLNGKTDRYSLFSPDDISACILLSGDANVANLRESWFATNYAPDENDRN